ncbi:MAG: hypothetical protein IJZ37_04850 [Clostridia bacterium]|nr:hypothetical protein [Clostridia bacterium]
MSTSKKVVSYVVRGILFLAYIALSLYLTFPTLHFKNENAIGWVALTVVIGFLLFGCWGQFKGVLEGLEGMLTGKKGYAGGSGAKKNTALKVLAVILAVLGVYMVFGFLSSLHFFRAKDYAAQMELKELSMEEFGTTISPESIGSNTLPIIDESISMRKAEGALGTYGSQFTLGGSNTLIHVNTDKGEELVRVIPLEYSGFFVALNKYSTGSVGYVKVNVVTEETELVLVDGGMPYLESGLLNYNLHRYVWMHYPTAMVTEYSFEIDDEGHPYWIVTYYDREVGLFGGEEPKGVILVNATSGEIEKYPMGKEPSWVDRVVPVDIAYAQSDNALTYKNGWFNVEFGAKKDVFNLTEEYNYISIDGETYMYSGITSPNNADETSVGFVLVNLKTKENLRYTMSGITEYRAKSIAEGDQKVKAQALTATDPILINIENTPTYFLTLKNGYQRLWYCLVRVSDGTVVLSEDLKSAKTEYLSIVTESGATSDLEGEDLKSVQGRVLRVRENAAENSLEFILEEHPEKLYVAPFALKTSVRFTKEGDVVSFKYIESGDGSALVRAFTNETVEKFEAQKDEASENEAR